MILSGSGALYYDWNLGVFDGSYFEPDSANLYVVVGTDSNGCQNTDNIFIDVAPLPEFSNVNIIDVEYGNDAAIMVDVVGGTPPYVYDWDNDGFGDMDDESNLYYIGAGEYELFVYDSLSCSIDTLLEVANSFQLYISGAITPNDDNINDRWVILGLRQYPQAQITVFNIHGQVVYENEGYYQYWDGRTENGQPLPASDYYYLINLVSPAQQFSGTVTITYGP